MHDTRYTIHPPQSPLDKGGIKGGLSCIMHHASCIFLIFASIFILTDTASAAKNPKEQYKKLQKEIETHKKKIEKTKKFERSTLEELEKTNKALLHVQAELRAYRNKRKAAENEISKVEADISANRIKLARQNEWLKRKLRVMQRHGYSGDTMLLLSTSEDMAQLIRRWRYIKELTIYDHKMLESYKKTIEILSEQENRLKILHAGLKKTEEKIKANEIIISEKRKGKERLLSSIRKEKTSYEKMLKELNDASKRLLEVIRRLEEAEAYSAKGFHNLKGKLHWPVNGKIAIPYGSQKDPQFNTPVFKSGIHIKAADDSTAKAVYRGKVVFAEWFKGYGQLIIISHGGGYHTLYANLSEIFCKVGAIIKEHEALGKIGESGTLNAPGLYFELRYKGKPLDPAQWLKKR